MAQIEDIFNQGEERNASNTVYRSWLCLLLYWRYLVRISRQTNVHCHKRRQ